MKSCNLRFRKAWFFGVIFRFFLMKKMIFFANFTIFSFFQGKTRLYQNREKHVKTPSSVNKGAANPAKFVIV